MIAEMKFRIENISEADWKEIPGLIKKFDLDSTDLHREQFVVCKRENVLCGFGRIRSFKGFDLFSSLAVLPEYRNQSVAQIIIEKLLQKARQDVFFVTALPAYFLKYGFEETTVYPDDLKKIVESCSLSCSCMPAVMVYKKQQN